MISILLLSLGLVLLYFGAEGLVRGSASIALRAGLSPLVVGLTIVAFGTSAPELVVSVKAAWTGQGGIAVGNVVGSNIFNIAVILGLSALIRPLSVQVQLIRFDTPLMIGASLLGIWFLRDEHLNRLEAGVLAAGLILYTGINIVVARRERSRAVEQEFTEGTPHVSRHPGVDILYIAGGLLLLVAGARFFVTAAVALAQRWGMSEAVIGLTIIAAGTSLPELATSIVAAMRRQSDIAVGNIVGSNVFNLLGILGVAGLVNPLAAGGVSPFDLGAMLVAAILLVPLMITRLRITRAEGALLLGLYAFYLWRLWPA